MKPKLDVESPQHFLLRRLKEEGRDDLVEAYHVQNRAYQRALAVRNRERAIEALTFRFSIAVPGSDGETRLKKQLEREQAALEKMKSEQ